MTDMTNAQVALMAAVKLESGRQYPNRDYVLCNAENYLDWLNEKDDKYHAYEVDNDR